MSQYINGSITTTSNSSRYLTDIQPLKKGGKVYFRSSGNNNFPEGIRLSEAFNDDTQEIEYYTLDGELSPCEPFEGQDGSWTFVGW